IRPRNPDDATPTGLTRHRFRLFPVRSPLLGKSRTCFLFLELLRCFSWLRWPYTAMDSPCTGEGLPRRVSPFGHRRVEACLQLTAAFRSLPRPSSPADAKASTIGP